MVIAVRVIEIFQQGVRNGWPMPSPVLNPEQGSYAYTEGGINDGE